MIELATKDYAGFASASLNLCTPGKKGKPAGNFDRHVEVYLGDAHVRISHYAWGIELAGGPKLRAAYLAARPSFGKGPEGFKPLERFVEREIRRHVARNSKTVRLLIREATKAGRREGREDARFKMRRALGLD